MHLRKIIAAAIIILSIQFLSCEKFILDPEEAEPPLPTVHDSRLATILDSLRYALELPALAAAIVTENRIIDAQAVGCRRYGGAANVTINDQFHLGSCGKAFTAALMGVLVDEGLVAWNTTLPEIFPEYNDIIRAEYREVAVKNLLSHSAGFMRDSDIRPESGAVKDQRLEIMKWAVKQPPVVQRGTVLYSNLGFLIAGSIIEKLTGRNYEELLLEKVIKPLGITTANFGAMGTPGMEDQPLQHSAIHAPITPTQNASLDPTYNPAGGLYMSIGDWSKFIQWILKIDPGHQTLLRQETARMLISPVVAVGSSNNGLGWGVTFIDGQKILSHSGSNGYNYCLAELWATSRSGIIVMTNQGTSDIKPPLVSAYLRVAQYYYSGN